MRETVIAPAEYNELLDSIKQTMAAGRLRAARAVNTILVETYWEIGRDIVRRQKEQGSGCPRDRAAVSRPKDGKPRSTRTVGS